MGLVFRQDKRVSEARRYGPQRGSLSTVYAAVTAFSYTHVAVAAISAEGAVVRIDVGCRAYVEARVVIFAAGVLGV